MRVIAGKFRSRPLKSLPGMEIRPTSDRLRETLFNVLCAGNPEALAGSTWLDLYAGTGAVGIEAISRGAGMVHFVEQSKAAADLITANLKSLGIVRGFEIIRADAAKALREIEANGSASDYVFLDPPYVKQDEYEKTLYALAHLTLLSVRTVVVAEHEKKFDPGDGLDNLNRYRKLTQSDATLSFYRLQAGN